MKKKILLIDGNSFCYRAFYAIRNLTTSSGQPTNAIYGFVTMLNKLIAEQRPDYLAVAFDVAAPTFRHKRFVNYKIKRRPMPEELSAQIPTIKEVLRAYHISIFEKEGYEADDVIATLAKRFTSPATDKYGRSDGSELEILIVTGDKDFLQIVNNTTKVLNPHKDNLILDELWVRKRFGVRPEKIREIMALAGDTADNIPGVPGIGEATAIELIKEFGTLDGVLANLDKITNKARAEKIKEFAQLARMSRELVQLDSNVPQLAQKKTSELLKKSKLVEADKKRLFEIFKELEFKTLLQTVIPESKDTVVCKTISHHREAEEFLKQLLHKKDVAVYFWTSQQQAMRAKILGASFSFAEEESFFFPLEKIPIETLKPILENKDIKKIGHDLKYLKVLLANYGIDLQGLSFDVMLAAYLLDPAKAKYGLVDLALEYLDCKLEDLHPSTLDKEAAKICSQFVNTILRLNKILQKQLRQKNLFALFQNIEMPLIEVLAEMEKNGVALDKDLLLHLSCDFESRLKSLTGQIYEMAGESFNINSPKQLSVILFEKLKLPRLKRTKTGTSTDTDVLQRLRKVHPLASALLEFREISKLKSTYIEGLMKLLHPATGRIHTSFNQTGTATGRLSSSQPNLQNIPIKTKLGKRIRQAFITDKRANLLLSADYSQIELRIMAHLCGDKSLISAFKEDLDIHAHTASLIFGVSQDEVTAQMRDTAKTVNFGISYGISAFGLARDLSIEQGQAQEFIEAYFQRYPGVKKYIARQVKAAKDRGFVTTLLERRRYIPQIESPNENVRQFAQRIAINAPVQGSASDLIKAAMIEIYRELKVKGLATKMLLQVHDELVFSVPEEELEEVKVIVKDKMENVIKLKVPIKVSIKVGKNWLEMK